MWGSALTLAAVCAVSALRASAGQKSTNDGIYSKAQADAAKPQFALLCSQCHAFTLATRKKEKDLLLGDEPFLAKWEGRSLDELLTVIVTTMPNDGSAVINDDEALNLLAYVLQQNGFRAGASPLNKAGASAIIARPGKSPGVF
jgi:mono/diheme cytochrome c family protein